MKKNEIVDYRAFRLNKINTPEFSHLKYLLYWPVYGLLFLTIERLWIRDSYYPIHCALDDMVPFCEYFLIPYLFWFVFLVGIQIYTLLFDTESFKKFMVFTMVSYSMAVLICILFPNCQKLRPVTLTRNNMFTRFIEGLYRVDTNTNVFPSVHVIGSTAVMLCAWKSRHFSTAPWRIVFGIISILISVSTVFLKQHSVLDVIGAVPVCVVSYFAAYGRKKAPS